MKEYRQTFVDKMLGGRKHSLIISCLFVLFLFLHFLGVFLFYENTIYIFITFAVLVCNGCYATTRLISVMCSNRKNKHNRGGDGSE